MRVGLAGIGKLGTAMMKQWSQKGRAVGVYHPDKQKAEEFTRHYQDGYVVMKKEFSDLDVLILALPAKEIMPFIVKLLAENVSLSQMKIINMASALHTKEIQNKLPNLSILGVKFMGHAKDLLERGNGLFISESLLPAEIAGIFSDLGRMKLDSEEQLLQVNKLATYYAVKAALEIEKGFAERGLAAEYTERALASLAPEVMRSYSEGTLGHFGKEIARDLKSEHTDK